MVVRSYKRSRPDGRWDAIVVGSGIGGLTTAALLAVHADKRVLVLEKHYTPGGFTQVFRRPGYEWDTGLHYVGEMGEGSPLRQILDQVTGGEVRWARMPECYDRVVLGERAFDLMAGRDALVEGLGRQLPGQQDAVREYVRLVARTSPGCRAFFADRALPKTLSRVLTPLTRGRFARMADRTVEDVLRPLLRDPTLYDVLTAQCGDYGLTPRDASFAIHAMVAGHFMDGGYYPVGGPSTLARAAAGVITRAGGAVYTNAAVERIVVENGRARGVRMKGGALIEAPVIISDAGAATTFSKLTSGERTAELAKSIREVGPSSAHVCLYLGLRRTDEELGFEGTNLWIYPEHDREEAFARFAQDPEAPIPLAYVSFPSAKDPSFAARYPGRSTVVIITLAQMAWFQQWARTRWMHRGAEYEAFKASLTERLLEAVDRRLPQLRPNIDHAELSTPLSTRAFTSHPSGEMYGLTHTPARFRLPLRAETPIPGLYLTGADLAVCGVGGATIGGAVCAGAILRGELATLIRRRVLVRARRLAAPAPVPAENAA